MIDNKNNLSDNDCLVYRPFLSDNSRLVKKEHYSTSLDPRGYIPVYEYVINNTPIMWDRETGYVHFTGIWKALGNSKSDIVKLVDSNPELGTKKIRGGFLRIQGTWIPYNFAHSLCKRTAWHIRKELVPIFGHQFPIEALSPDHEEYGCLLLEPSKNSHHSNGKRRSSTTMRQNVKSTTPYVKKQRSSPINKSNQPPVKRVYRSRALKSSALQKMATSAAAAVVATTATIKKQNEAIASSMSVTRLLNQMSDSEDDTLSSLSDGFDDDDMSMTLSDYSPGSCSSSSIGSPRPSPSFRVVQTHPSSTTGWLNQTSLLPPIYMATGNEGYGYSSHWSNSSRTNNPTSPLPSNNNNTVMPNVSQDIIDTISATILLQRLSQDDGARPFKPIESSGIPSKVIVGQQEFTICWD